MVAIARVIAFVSIGLALTGRAQAQQKPPDSTKTRSQITIERLRSLKPLIDDTTTPDSATLAALDSVRQDSLRRAGRPATRAPASFARDTVMERLMALAGYAVTEYKADSARFEADSNRLDLRRNAEVLREGQHIAADSSIIFDQNTSIACAHGLPTVSTTGGSSPFRADSLCYNVDTQRGQGYAVTTEITEGANWIVHSERGFTVGDTLYSHGGMFTDCALDPPHYHFGAGEMKYIGRDIIVARNVTFNFQDVPVFWLPFFVQSTKQGRRSGILTPRFGVNDIVRQNSGYSRQISDVGFFWAINDYMGTEVAMDWQSNNFMALRGTLDYRFLRQFLAGSMTWRQYWKSEGGRDFTISANSDWRPDERTRLGGSVSYATSTQFVRQRSINPREINQNIRSNVGVNRRFNWGSVDLSGSRTQQISDGTIDMTLPSLNLNLAPVTLFAADPGAESWYSNATWNGSFNAQRLSKSVQTANQNRSVRGRNDVSGRLSSSFSLGRFGISQGVQFSDVTDLERRYPDGDTTPILPERSLRDIRWNAGASWQQKLIGTTTLTPGISFSGQMIQGDTTNSQQVAAPTRINFNASLRSDLYGFFPGVGPIERMRHRVSPSFSYTYSPSPTITDRQREVFRLTEIREQNQLTIGISQTFEARMRQSETAAPGGTPTPADTMAVADSAGGPRRRQTVQPITILSINTDAVIYDFVQAREGFGVQTMEIGNNIQSDLLRGLQLSFAHDLFVEDRDSTNALLGRDFRPHLSRLSASFSLNADSWLARTLGFGRSRETQQQQQQQGAPMHPDSMAAMDTTRVPQMQRTGEEFGMLGSNRGRDVPQLGQGNWNASFSYSLSRPRGGEGGLENQMLSGNMSFQPTAQWSLQWSTGYNFTQGEFTDHILTLTRMLHDWDAHFDFVKAQNGNFSFQFRVQLRANPDIKLDYEQREVQRTQFVPGND